MPRISEETIQRVAEASDIVEVVGSYFPLKRAGTSWKALCPFHREKSPSFSVNPQRQTFHCFGCGAGGSVYRFLMDYEHITFGEAVRRLAQRAGVPVVEEAGGEAEEKGYSERKRLLSMHAEAAAWFHQQLLRSPAAGAARDYLKSRGLTAETAKAWTIGYAPDSWDALIQLLKGKKFSLEEIAKSGLASSKEESETGVPNPNSRLYARFRDRVMFPIRNDYGEVIAFSGRVLDPQAKTAKYVNSPETPIFSKGRVLFGLDKSKRSLIEASTAIVCEGQIDLITAFESGVTNVIAPQGTAFTPEQARLLLRFVETVVLCFDSDRAGQEAVTRSLPALLECGLEVRVARLPVGEDPDSLIRTQGAEVFQRHIAEARNFFDNALDLLMAAGGMDDPVKKAAASRKLATFVPLIKDPVQREAVMGRISARLGIAPAAFQAQMRSGKKQVARVGNDEEPEVPREAPFVMPAGVVMLCQLAIADAKAKSWLATQLLAEPQLLGEEGNVLRAILRYDAQLDSPAALNTFASTLPPREEKALATMGPRRVPEDALGAAREAWRGMLAQTLRDQREAAKNRLRQPSLPAAETLALQKQILDLSARLNDLFRPVPQDSA